MSCTTKKKHNHINIYAWCSKVQEMIIIVAIPICSVFQVWNKWNITTCRSNICILLTKRQHCMYLFCMHRWELQLYKHTHTLTCLAVGEQYRFPCSFCFYRYLKFARREEVSLNMRWSILFFATQTGYKKRKIALILWWLQIILIQTLKDHLLFSKFVVCCHTYWCL